MIIKTLLYSLVIFVLLSCLAFFLVINKNQRWLLFYGDSAEKYAKALLEKSEIKTPDAFIDYTISAKDGYVIFSQHNNSTLYGYFNEKPPLNYKDAFKGKKWELLENKWFFLSFDTSAQVRQ